MARQCVKPKRKRDATWFRDKVLLVKAQGNGKVLNEKELEFLAGPGIAKGPVTQSVITHNATYQADDLDAYDYDCDEISTAKAVLMANLSSYGSDVLSEYLIKSQNAAVQDINSSAQQDDLILSVFEQLSNQVTNCNKVNNDNLIANETLFAKLERYKERVKLLEERQNVDLEKELLTKTFNVFKNESKEKEANNIDTEIALENKVKELDNIFCNSAQTMHMLTKPQVFYDNNLKQALGFQNPFYLKKAQQIRPMLYDGNVISKETNVISIADSEETLILKEEILSKMLLKQSDPMVLKHKVNIKPINYAKLNRLSKDFGVARPKFDKDAKFELKGQFLKELREHTFSGSENKDANEHIQKVLKIVDLFTTPNVTSDQLMLPVSPITLTGAASRCMQEVILFYKGLDVPTRQILDSKGVVPKLSAADAKKAIQEMVDHSQKWHDGISTRNKSINTSDRFAAVQAQLNNLSREIKKVNERVYVAQVGCELCNRPHCTKDFPLKEEGKTLEDAYYTQFEVPFPQAGRYKAAAPGFYQRDKGNTSYQERRQTMEESLNKFMAESTKRHDEHSSLIKKIRASTDAAIRNQGASIKALEIQIGQMSKVLQERGSGSLPSSTETNPKDHVKSITTTKEVETLKKDDKMPLIKLSRATIPFLVRLKENGYDEKEVLKELKMIQVNSTKSATSLRRLLKEKSRIEEEIETTMNVHCSSILKDALASKKKTQGVK
ncbi:hypothetical protein Tco_0982878, partial [Tanacetum coccineum]